MSGYHFPGGGGGGSGSFGDPSASFEVTGSAVTTLSITGLPTTGRILWRYNIVNGSVSNCDYTTTDGLTGEQTIRSFALGGAFGSSTLNNIYFSSNFGSKQVAGELTMFPDISPGATNIYRSWFGWYYGFSTVAADSVHVTFSGLATDVATASTSSRLITATQANGLGIGTVVDVWF